MKRVESNYLNHADVGKLLKTCSYTGVFMMFLTLSVPMYWGNLSTYTESYFRHHLGPSLATSAAWMVPCYNIGWCCSVIFAGHIERFIGWKWTVILSVAFLDTGIFLSFICVQYSIVSLNLSLGILNGVGTGIMMTMGLQCVLSLKPKYPGTATGVITSARHLGGACWNQVITWYINHTNLSPDVHEGRQTYFSQREVLNKVPSVFLVIGVVYLFCHTIGIVLIRHNVDGDHEVSGENSALRKNIGVTEGVDDKARDANGLTVARQPTQPLENSQTRNVSPKEMLKKPSFYVLCLVLSFVEYSDIVLMTFYKSYGQIWIADDQFIACFATTFLLVSVLTRPLFGGLFDACGVKYSTMLLNCVACIISSFWYFSPMVNRWLFFVWTMLYSCISAGCYLLVYVAAFEMFGRQHFSKNYGLVMFSPILINLIVPKFIQEILHAFGWFCLFISASCLSACGTILIALWFPKK